ncbi:MAG: ATP-binding protein, partial [Spirochaetaceae bacterium]|nr:ATP-binding protein [Spirochaetaceae bacterium]
KKYPSVNIEFSSNKDEINLPLPQDYFDRVAENLIDNAMSFGTEVSVSSVLGKDYFCFSVEDNGKGVSEEALSKIFERFYSERDESQNNAFSHTGLGLSIVRAIADSLEGEICVSESEKLGGAKFCFSIPYKFNFLRK